MATKLPLSVPVADKIFAAVVAGQAVGLLAPGSVPPGVAAFVAAKGPLSAADIRWQGRSTVLTGVKG